MSLIAELRRRNVFRVGIAYGIMSWVLLQAADFLLDLIGAPNWVIQSLFIIVALGLPVALFFAWAFELTPEGIKREKEVDPNESIAPVTGRKLDRTIMALLAIAVVYFALDKFVLQRPDTTAPTEVSVQAEVEMIPSIAVLPLADMSPDGGDNEYFSDGLTEELLNILAKIKELQVAGRTSSFAFKGQNEDLREIGRKLNVAHILEGSVRKDDANNRVRITLQLIDTESGFHLWSETYDRDLEDIFALQEEIAEQVASALRVTLLGEDTARLQQVASTDVDVYDLFLQGRYELGLGGFANLERAENLFQQVLAQDPDYLPARMGLAETWAQMGRTGSINTAQAVERGVPALQVILEQEPDNASALALLADYQQAVGDDAEAVGNFQRALELDPNNAITLIRYGSFLFDNAEVERGIALIDRAVEIEPLDPQVLWESCGTSGPLGQFEKALSACRRIQELRPDGPQGYYGEALAYSYQGNIPQTLVSYEQAILRDPEDYEMIAAIAMFWLAVGDDEQARAWLNRAEAIGAGQPIPTHARILLLEFSEQYDQAGELAAAALARKMDDRHNSEYFFRRANTAAAAHDGDWERGLAPYREVMPWLFEAELVFPEDAAAWVQDIIFVAALMKAAEPLSDRPEKLLDFAQANAASFHPKAGQMTLPYQLAQVYALRGEREKALEQIRAYQAFGLFIYWRQDLLLNPAFASLRNDPEFRTLVEQHAALAEQQRIEARALLGVDS